MSPSASSFLFFIVSYLLHGQWLLKVGAGRPFWGGCKGWYLNGNFVCQHYCRSYNCLLQQQHLIAIVWMFWRKKFRTKKTFDVTVVGVCLQKYMSFLLHCASTVIYITMIKKHSVYRKNLKSDNVVRTTWCNFFVFRVQTYRLTHFASHTFCEVSVQRLIISNSRLVSSFLFIHLFITHAGFIAAGVGRTFSRVCLSACLFVRALKGKRLELSTLSLVRIYCISQSLGMHWPRCQKVKGQGHTVTKTVTVARLLVTRAATAVCCCCRRGSACRYDCLCFLVHT